MWVAALVRAVIDSVSQGNDSDEGADRMNITTGTQGGKFYAWVRKGMSILFQTPGYITEAMALADARCWLAFHGGESMDMVTVDMNEVYVARQKGTGVWREETAERVARAVAEAYRFNLTVEVKEGTMGQRYIQISDGKGSSYSQWHMGADFRDRVINKYQGATMLTPAGTENVTRPERYGQPDYYGKIEWFDAIDRETDELLPYQVSRVDGREVIVNGPKGLILPGLANLQEAVEVINERRAA